MTPTGTHKGMTTGALTIAALKRYPDRNAFWWDAGELSYRGAADLIGRFQQVFHGAGLARGQRIAVLSGNDAVIWCASAAAQASGITTTWLHPAGSLEDHCFQVQDVEAEALIFDTDHHRDRAEALAARFEGVPSFSHGQTQIGRDLLLEAERVGEASAVDYADADDYASVMYTGGTTGRSKGVLRTHRTLCATWIAILAHFELPSQPNHLAVAPISHVGGMKILPVLQRGGAIRMMTGFSASKVIDVIRRERINMSLLVPTMIYGMLDDPSLRPADLRSLELLMYGAAAMSPRRLQEAIERIGPIFSQFYGQTEGYPIAVLQKQDHDIRDTALLASCGMPVASNIVTLRDTANAPVSPGEIGEICARGPCIMDGYLKRDDLTADTLRDGWLHTGDLARADERGFLHIVDRIKDMVITGGFNVFTREVEDALMTHPAVAEAAVFGVPDEKWGEAVVAAVVLQDGMSVVERDLIARVRDQKGPVHAPKHLRFVERLPTTAIGKVDKKQLRAAHLAFEE